MTGIAEPKVAVRNAADREQVRRAKETEKQRRDRELEELRTVLSSVSGRRVLWRFLERCGVFRSIMETNARIYYNAGQQDLGHYLMGEIASADPEAWLAMQQDAAQIEKNKVEPKPRSEESIEDV